MRIAFVLIPEKGHVNPYIGPAQALQERGHTVVVAAPGDIAAQLVAAAGLGFHALPGSSDRPTHGAALVELIQDADRLAAWVGQLRNTGVPWAAVFQFRLLATTMWFARRGAV